MRLKDKVLDFIGIGIEESDTNDDSDEILEEEADTPKAKTEPKKSLREQRLQGGGEPVNMANVAAMKMIVYHPVSYEDAQNIIDNLRAHKPVIVNLEDLEINCAQRILDFLSGAIYALQGTTRKISRNIFVFAPANYDVIGNEESGDEDYLDM